MNGMYRKEERGMGKGMDEMKECRLVKGDDTTERVRMMSQKRNRK